MPSELGQLGPITLRTYTLLIDLAILIGLGGLTLQGWRLDDEPAGWLDTGLAALVGGILGGRAAHVAIHWQYFSNHPMDIPAFWYGGIDWHGAALMGLLALLIASRIRQISFRDVTDTLAILLPVGAALACAGCLASGCGHGREVATLGDYPRPLVGELPDLYGIVAPRFQTQLFGIVLNVVLLALALIQARIPRLNGARLWIILALMGAGMFGIDFTRGDAMPVINGLRLDQILDLAIALVGLIGIGASRRPYRASARASRVRQTET